MYRKNVQDETADKPDIFASDFVHELENFDNDKEGFIDSLTYNPRLHRLARQTAEILSERSTYYARLMSSVPKQNDHSLMPSSYLDVLRFGARRFLAKTYEKWV